MRGWRLVIVIAIPLGLFGYAFGYEGMRFINMRNDSAQLQETARVTLESEVYRQRLRLFPLPPSPRIWPDSERRMKDALVKKAGELQIPIGEKDIALWHDESKVYCRVAWTQPITFFAFSLESILRDWTVEVSMQ